MDNRQRALGTPHHAANQTRGARRGDILAIPMKLGNNDAGNRPISAAIDQLSDGEEARVRTERHRFAELATVETSLKSTNFDTSERGRAEGVSPLGVNLLARRGHDDGENIDAHGVMTGNDPMAEADDTWRLGCPGASPLLGAAGQAGETASARAGMAA